MIKCTVDVAGNACETSSSLELITGTEKLQHKFLCSNFVYKIKVFDSAFKLEM